MKTYQDYKAVAAKIDAVARELGISALKDDISVNIENLNFPYSDHMDHSQLIANAINAFGMRCEARGLDANDYGFNY